MITFNEATVTDCEMFVESVDSKVKVHSLWFESGEKKYVSLDILIRNEDYSRKNTMDFSYVDVTGKTEEEIENVISQRIEYGKKIAPLFLAVSTILPAENAYGQTD
ncbi:hypothetical protein [Caudoviricetes sp.]|nr:hypothetical protein [Caudoviricetes sp.]